MSPFPQGLFSAPKMFFSLKTRVLRCPHSRRGFFFAPKVRFFLKPGCCGVPIPAGAFFSAQKRCFFLKTRGLRCPHSRRGFFFAQKVCFLPSSHLGGMISLACWADHPTLTKGMHNVITYCKLRSGKEVLRPHPFYMESISTGIVYV